MSVDLAYELAGRARELADARSKLEHLWENSVALVVDVSGKRFTFACFSLSFLSHYLAFLVIGLNDQVGKAMEGRCVGKEELKAAKVLTTLIA